MTAHAVPSPILEDLSAQYDASDCAGGGGARWLRHAWYTLAAIGQVPHEIPMTGQAAVEARIRLGVLAALSGRFQHLSCPEEVEPPPLTEGRHAVGDQDVLTWMTSRGIRTEYEWIIEVLDDGEDPDPSERYVHRADIEACLAHLEGEVMRSLLAVRDTTELFLELSAQRHDMYSLLGIGTLDDDPAPITYPLQPAVRSELLARADDEAHRALEWLEQYAAAVLRR
jgi:hypothetical protein